jgi:hypothetical protein
VLEKLDRLVDDISSLNSKLVLLIGPPRSGKTSLLNDLAKRRQTTVINVGSALGRQLLPVPNARRHLKAADLLKQLADGAATGGVALLDNIELLFDQTLQLNPLDLLKRHAHVRRVIAAWPGELNDNRLTYATMGHPEHQDYGVDGLIPFKVH